jgi:hypothetical protein
MRQPRIFFLFSAVMFAGCLTNEPDWKVPVPYDLPAQTLPHGCVHRHDLSPYCYGCAQDDGRDCDRMYIGPTIEWRVDKRLKTMYLDTV